MVSIQTVEVKAHRRTHRRTRIAGFTFAFTRLASYATIPKNKKPALPTRRDDCP